uniref:Uncharacterized protein n=1 Tax=Anopheles merus TaxID=30066 RepID=A0A182VFY1_ANOME
MLVPAAPSDVPGVSGLRIVLLPAAIVGVVVMVADVAEPDSLLLLLLQVVNTVVESVVSAVSAQMPSFTYPSEIVWEELDELDGEDELCTSVNPAYSTSGGFSVSLRQVFNSVGEFSSSELLAVRGTSSRLLVVRWKNTVVPTLPPVPPGPLQMVALAVRLVGVWLVDSGVAVPMPPISRGRANKQCEV